MSQSTTRYHDPLNLKKNGCLWLVFILGTIACIIMLPWGIDIFFKKGPKLQPQTVLKDIRLALTSYDVDYGHYPIPDFDLQKLDVTVRSRGPMVPALLGMEGSSLNPKRIKFIDLPAAKNRKHGLWQEGSEWVLSDLWGEPYYIILDLNKDGQVPNPEFGAKDLEPRLAEYFQKFPPPEKLPLEIALYSSGPDRDPKTWRDNVCSWRSR